MINLSLFSVTFCKCIFHFQATRWNYCDVTLLFSFICWCTEYPDIKTDETLASCYLPGMYFLWLNHISLFFSLICTQGMCMHILHTYPQHLVEFNKDQRPWTCVSNNKFWLCKKKKKKRYKHSCNLTKIQLTGIWNYSLIA